MSDKEIAEFIAKAEPRPESGRLTGCASTLKGCGRTVSRMGGGLWRAVRSFSRQHDRHARRKHQQRTAQPETGNSTSANDE